MYPKNSPLCCCNNICCRQYNLQWRNNAQAQNCNICCEYQNTPLEPGISKGLVQTLKDKLVYLQNESTKFKLAKKPIKKKQQKDYYCLMLRKINTLDRKLQNLENLFLSHVNHPSNRIFSPNNNEKNCENLQLYNSVRSLIDLANKLREDVYKNNDTYWNNQNVAKLYDQIQVLESELRYLSSHLEQVHSSEDCLNGQKLLIQKETNNPCNHSPCTRNYIGTRKEGPDRETKSKPKKKQRKKKYYKSLRKNKTEESDQNNLLDIKSQKQFDRKSSSKSPSLPQNTASTITSHCSGDICNMNTELWESRNRQPISYPLPSNSSLFSSIKVHTNNNNNTRTFGMQSNVPKVQLMRSPNTHEVIIFNSDSDDNNNSQHKVQKAALKRGTVTQPFQDKEEKICPCRHQSKVKYHKKKQKRAVPVQHDFIPVYYIKSQNSSPNRPNIEYIHKPTNKEKMKLNKKSQIINIPSPQSTNLKHNKKEQIRNIYYSVTPKKENNFPKKKKNRKGYDHFEQQTQHITHNKGEKSKEGRKMSKRQHKKSYNNNDVRTYSYKPNEAFNQKTNFDKTMLSDFSSSESEASIHMQNYGNIPARTKSKHNSDKKYHSAKKHLHVKLYNNEQLEEFSDQSCCETDFRHDFEPLHFNRNNKYRFSNKVKTNNSTLSTHKQDKKYFPRQPFYKFKMNQQFSYETVIDQKTEEDDYNSDSSSQHKLYVCNDPMCIRRRNPGELIIPLNSNNIQSSSDNSDFKNNIGSPTSFEQLDCDDCIIQEKNFTLLPNKKNTFKGKERTKIRIKKETIKCPTCRDKLNGKLFHVISRKLTINNIQDAEDLVVKENNVVKKTDNKLSENDDEGKNNIEISSSGINIKKENEYSSRKPDTVVPIFQAKLQHDNLFNPTNLNATEEETSKSLQFPNFGNTINISFESGSYSVDKENNNQMNKTRTFKDQSRISHLPSEMKAISKTNSKSQIEIFGKNKAVVTNDKLNSVNTESYNLYSDLTNNKVQYLKHNETNNFLGNVKRKSTPMEISNNVPNGFMDNRLKNEMLINIKPGNLTEVSNGNCKESTEYSEIKPEMDTKENCNKNTFTSSKTQMDCTLVGNKKYVEIGDKDTHSKIKQDKKQIPRRNSNISNCSMNINYGDNKPVTEANSKNMMCLTAKVSDFEVEKPFKTKEKVIKSYDYTNRINMPNKNHHKPPLYKKVIEHFTERNEFKTKCNACPKTSCSTKVNDKFNTSRRASKLFKHRLAVYPRNSKDLKVGNGTKIPNTNKIKYQQHYSVQRLSTSTSSVNCTQRNYLNPLYSTAASESSYSALNWGKIAKKLKEEKNYKP